jgi:hypothetical protein
MKDLGRFEDALSSIDKRSSSDRTSQALGNGCI